MPLLGFEADRRWRRAALRLNNALNLRRARRGATWRVAIHPHDLRLLMRGDLERLLAAVSGAPARTDRSA